MANYQLALISDHPETKIYCDRTSNTIFAPLDVVIWNDQTPTSSGTKLALEFRPRYDPIPGWALISYFTAKNRPAKF